MTKKERYLKRRDFFFRVWDEREREERGKRYVECFESGRQLPRKTYRLNSCCYSHVLGKSEYPEYEFEDWNIVIIHPDYHLNHSDSEKCPKQNKLRQFLIKTKLNSKK